MNQNDLSTRAMLVSLSISQWSARKHDKKASREVAANHGTTEAAGRYNKNLLPGDSAPYAAVTKAANAARTEHYRLTLPWSDEGSRILPASAFMTYTGAFRKSQADFDAAVRNFCTEYPTMRAGARVMLNGLYNDADYPDVAQMPALFSMGMNVLPLPAGQDFRVNLSDDDAAAIRAQIEETSNAAVTAAMRDLWQRLYDSVAHMAERLGDSKAIFRDSLVTNIRDLCAILPKLNSTDDPALTLMRDNVLAQLTAYTPEALRDNDWARSATAGKAQDIMNQMQAIMGGL